MKLDWQGVDYLIAMAKDAGFGILSLDTHQDMGGAPIIKMEFIQTRDVDKPKPEPDPLSDDAIIPLYPNRPLSVWPQDKPKSTATLDE